MEIKEETNPHIKNIYENIQKNTQTRKAGYLQKFPDVSDK